MKKEENNFASKLKEMMQFQYNGKGLFFAIFCAVLAIAMSFSALSQIPDPGHSASAVGPGTFYGGNYTFPNSLFISQSLGIGTTAPVAHLDVRGNPRYDDSTADPTFVIRSASYPNKNLRMGYDTTGGNDFAFIQAAETGVSVKNLILQGAGGSIGVGTASPSYTFDVRGNYMQIKNANAEAGLVIDSGTSSAQQSSIYFRDRGTTKYQFFKDSANALLITDVAQSNRNVFKINSGSTLQLNPSTSVNIGSTGKAVLYPDIADSSGAVAYTFDTLNNLQTSGAKIASFKNYGNEKAYLDKDGFISVAGGLHVQGIGTAPTNAYAVYAAKQSTAIDSAGVKSYVMVSDSAHYNTAAFNFFIYPYHSSGTLTTAYANYGYFQNLAQGTGNLGTGAVLYGIARQSSANTVSNLNGVDIYLLADANSGAISTARGFKTSATVQSGANIGSLRHLDISNVNNAGTVSYQYGIYINNLNGASDNYAIYSEGGKSLLKAGTASYVPLTIQGAASQTANLQEWKNSANSVLAYVDKDGKMYETTGRVCTAANGLCNQTFTNNITGSGAATHLAYWKSASQLGYDSDGNLFWDPTNNRLGIGTVTPSRKLDVVDASNPQLRLTQTDNSVFTDLRTTNSGYLYINTSGNRIGVESSTPYGVLDIIGTASGNTYSGNGGSTLRVSHTTGNYNSTTGLYVFSQDTHSANSPVTYGIAIDTYASHSGTATGGSITGLYALTRQSSSKPLTYLYGINSYPYITGSGLVSASYGLYTNTYVSSASSLTNFYGVYIAPPIVEGSLTHAYALYIGKQNKATGDNYAIYTAGGTTFHQTGRSNLKGIIIRGETNQTASLQEWQNGTTIVGGMSASGRLFVGSNTNPSSYLYVRGDTSIAPLFTLSDTRSGYAREWGFTPSDGDFRISDITAGNQIDLYLKGGSGYVGIYNTNPQGQLHITSRNSSTKTLIVQGASGQSTNLQEWKNSANSVLAYVDKDGKMYETTGRVCTAANGLCNQTFTNNITGSGAATHLAYWKSASQLGYDSDGNLFWDPTNNRLGIGTVSPTERLDVSGNIRSTSNIYTGSNNFVYTYGIKPVMTGYPVSIYNNSGSKILTVSENGRVGILTETPSNALEVNGNVELTNLYDNDASNFFDLSGCGDNTYVSGIDSTGAVTCAAESGDISEVVAGNGLTGGAASGSATLDINLATGSGLQISSDQLSLLRTCSANQILKWNTTHWYCANDNQGTEVDTLHSVTTRGNSTTNPINIDTNGDQTSTFGGSLEVGKNLKVDSTTLTVNSLTKRVGIGTSTPSYLLHVAGTEYVSQTIGVESLPSSDKKINANTSSANYALWGGTASTSGTAVYGKAYSATGTTYGIYGEVNSANGYPAYFSGGKGVYSSSGFYVGATTDDKKIDDSSNGASSSTLYIGNQPICTPGNALCNQTEAWLRTGTTTYLKNSGDQVNVSGGLYISSTGQLTDSNSDVIVNDDLQVSGNDIKDSNAKTRITFDATKGDVIITLG